MREGPSILTPSQVGQYIKGFMDRDRVLSGLQRFYLDNSHIKFTPYLYNMA